MLRRLQGFPSSWIFHELEQPQRMDQIRREHVIRIERHVARKENAPLVEVFAEADRAQEPDEDDDQGCLVCHL